MRVVRGLREIGREAGRARRRHGRTCRHPRRLAPRRRTGEVEDARSSARSGSSERTWFVGGRKARVCRWCVVVRAPKACSHVTVADFLLRLDVKLAGAHGKSVTYEGLTLHEPSTAHKVVAHAMSSIMWCVALPRRTNAFLCTCIPCACC